ncbi:MAG TPA: hypothetical protein VLF79_02560 [Candidatus Saccharimonadales bacterium]|nr:hypothetical protein [Candidatus Saccharimonadales bacterium]
MIARHSFNRQTVCLWLLAVMIGCGLLLFSYVAIQQSLRLSLNDPQWQIAEDTSIKLASGADPTSVLPTTIDESQSLSPFVTIVDNKIHVIASSGKIGNIVPLPPASSFTDSQKRGHNWFTWQHNDNTLRDATVIVTFHSGSHSGYVLVARSMKQVENTIQRITLLAGLTLIGILIVPTIILLLI